MAFLDWMMPGKAKKAELRKEIEGLAEAARRESGRQGLPSERAVLWENLCDEASDIVYQLLVQNRESDLDWGLKSHRGKVSQSRLATIHWWMLLYQLVMFKNRGLDGYVIEEEFPQLYGVAQRFVNQLVSAPEYGGVTTASWEEGWESQVALEASLGIYNRTVQLLGLATDLEKRIGRVSLFTTATERAYDSMARRLVSSRNQTI